MNYADLSREELIARLQHYDARFGHAKEFVHVPAELKDAFQEIGSKVSNYFNQLKFEPENGTISIDNERYILVRAGALSHDFFEIVTKLYADQSEETGFAQGKNFLFDLAHVIGTEDARIFHEKLHLTNPIDKLSAGPVHFALTGWAFVDILPDSNPVPTGDFLLKYNHPYSFEADAWIKKGKLAKEPVCIMNAAYSAAWCSESFGLNLSAVEISCRACGDETCSFIMAPTDKIEAHLAEKRNGGSHTNNPPPLFFERKKIEEKMLANEAMLKDAQQMAQIGSWQFNFETQELHWSDELYRIFEIDHTYDNQLYATYLSKIPPDDQEKLNELVAKTLETGEPYQFQHTVIANPTTHKWVWCTGIPWRNEQGAIIGLKGVIQDITEKLTLQKELDSFFEMSVDLLCIANEQGYFLKTSPSWTKLLGYTEEELCAVPFVQFVHPDDLKKTIQESQNLNNGELSLRFENRYRKKNGEYVNLGWNAMINQSNGLIYATARDITLQKEKEQQLQHSISEKETLLKEIHHRVKNNLQIISSLLSLQSKMNRKNEKLNRLYEDSMNRINSMAALHELFYQSDNLQRIDFADYIDRLATDLTQTFRGHAHQISITLNLEPTKLNLDTAVPLGLTVNEILTNSFKHAFWNKDKGEIYISLEKTGDQTYCMKIGDNGSGIMLDTKPEEGETLGMSLIFDLINQLDGTVTISNTEGTHYTLTFKEQ
jgi:PAS domain S-box-containing protein